MSENIPESIPTSADPRSKRAVKKRALTPRSAIASDVEALFKKPDREIRIPTSEPKKGPAPPPEIVANVQGSSAGAGSGEFHVYKASRRREYERLRLMDEEVAKEQSEKEFEQKRAERERLDRERTEKNRLKREKAKARKMKGKKGGKGQEDKDEEGTGGEKRKLAPNAVPVGDDTKDEDDKLNGGEVKNTEETGLVIQDEDD
jgi:hypothetical protein